MRVLVIEDDKFLRGQLAQQLKEKGYTVDVEKDGEAGLNSGLDWPIDVAIVDIGVPKLSGLEVIRKWRAKDRKFPVLILTGRREVQDKVKGLKVGGDDYLVKPFYPEELLARLEALLRRGEWSGDRLHYPPFELDLRRRVLTAAGEPIKLPNLEYKVVEYLMRKAGGFVSRGALEEYVYAGKDKHPNSNSLQVIIFRIRKKIDPDGTLDPIEMSRGRGYRFRLSKE